MVSHSAAPVSLLILSDYEFTLLFKFIFVAALKEWSSREIQWNEAGSYLEATLTPFWIIVWLIFAVLLIVELSRLLKLRSTRA